MSEYKRGQFQYSSVTVLLPLFFSWSFSLLNYLDFHWEAKDEEDTLAARKTRPDRARMPPATNTPRGPMFARELFPLFETVRGRTRRRKKESCIEALLQGSELWGEGEWEQFLTCISRTLFGPTALLKKIERTVAFAARPSLYFVLFHFICTCSLQTMLKSSTWLAPNVILTPVIFL